MTTGQEYFRRCSTCKQPIDFESPYYECSVSTCNRKRTGLFFCSIGCWEAHVPMMRHRDAWAVEARAPTRQEHERAEREAEASSPTAAADPSPRRRVVGAPPVEDDLPRDVLVVVSKLKAYVRARSGMNTSDSVTLVLSNHLRRLCDAAIRKAAVEGRKTVLDRDFEF